MMQPHLVLKMSVMGTSTSIPSRSTSYGGVELKIHLICGWMMHSWTLIARILKIQCRITLLTTSNGRISSGQAYDGLKALSEAVSNHIEGPRLESARQEELQDLKSFGQAQEELKEIYEEGSKMGTHNLNKRSKRMPWDSFTSPLAHENPSSWLLISFLFISCFLFAYLLLFSF